jgi:hypothetical protein
MRLAPSRVPAVTFTANVRRTSRLRLQRDRFGAPRALPMNYLMKVKWHGDPTVRELFTNLKATRPDWTTNSLVAAKELDGKRASNTLAVKPSKAVLSPENPLRFTETDHLCLVSHGKIICKREGKTLKVRGLGGLSDEMSHSLHAHDRAGAGSTDWFVTKV